MCSVLWQGTLLLQCCSPPFSINGYRLNVKANLQKYCRETWLSYYYLQACIRVYFVSLCSCWPSDWLTNLSTDWPIHCPTDWPTNWLIVRLTACEQALVYCRENSAGAWLTVCLIMTDWLTVWLIVSWSDWVRDWGSSDWLSYWLIHGWIDWLIGWFTGKDGERNGWSYGPSF